MAKVKITNESVENIFAAFDVITKHCHDMNLKIAALEGEIEKTTKKLNDAAGEEIHINIEELANSVVKHISKKDLKGRSLFGVKIGMLLEKLSPTFKVEKCQNSR